MTGPRGQTRQTRKPHKAPSDGGAPAAPQGCAPPSPRHARSRHTAPTQPHAQVCARLAPNPACAEPFPQVVLQNRRQRLRVRPKDNAVAVLGRGTSGSYLHVLIVYAS